MTSIHHNKIVVIISFSQEIANPNSNEQSYQQLHQYFFQATFYSLYRYFSNNIVAYVALDNDKILLNSWNIPAKEIL